jgi:hypothetical protein
VPIGQEQAWDGKRTSGLDLFFRRPTRNGLQGCRKNEQAKTIGALLDRYALEIIPIKDGKGIIKELALLHGYYDKRYLDELAEVAREYTTASTEADPPVADSLALRAGRAGAARRGHLHFKLCNPQVQMTKNCTHRRKKAPRPGLFLYCQTLASA